jgi:single-strand DNA-binding protein
MTKGLNKVQLIGRLGATPEMRYTVQGNAVTTFRIAVDRAWKDASGEKQTETDWFRVVAWNTLAENCNQFLDTGHLAYVEGRLQIRKWADQGGQTRYVTEVVAQDVIFLDGRPDGGSTTDDVAAEDPEMTASTSPRPAAARSHAHAVPAPSTAAPTQAPSPPSPGKGRARRTTAPSRASAGGPSNGAFDEEDLPF